MKKRLIALLFLIAYCAILIKVMVFKDVPLIRIGPIRLNFGGTQEGAANLIPFKTILPYLLGENGFVIAALNIGGNIVLLIPVGFIVPFIYQKMTWKKSLILAFAAGFAIEGMQEILHVGIFDIDDVILNGFGVMVGFWMFQFLTNKARSKKTKNIIVITTAVIAIAGAAVVYSLTVSAKNDLRPNFRARAGNGPSAGTDSQAAAADSGRVIPEGEDPCNGTGGTGQIVDVANHDMTIRKNDGADEVIHLTTQTSIRNSRSAVSESDLKTGYRVTVVVEANHTATAVLVCNGSIAAPVK